MYDCKTYQTTLRHPCNSDLKGWDYIDATRAYFAEKDGLMDDVLRLAGEHGCLLIMDPGRTSLDRWYYLHPSLRVEGWQLSHFDQQGPICHDDIRNDPHELSHALPDFIECWWVA